MELAPHECYRRIKPVNLEKVLADLDELRFVDSGGICAWVTDPTSKAPASLVFLIRELELGGRHARMFCRRLAPHQSIAPHRDTEIQHGKTRLKAGEWRRFHVPLKTHPDVKMRWPEDGQELHLEPGWLYEVRYDRTHEVVNPTDCERIHIQIDQIGATI